MRPADPPPESRCIICDRPSCDHSWRHHPVTMIDHYLAQWADRL